MTASPHFTAENCVNGASAGWNTAPEACNELTDACIRALQDCNTALWARIVPPQDNSAASGGCNAPLYAFNAPAQDNRVALQDYIEAARSIFAALQPRIAKLLPFFVALRSGGGPMQASAAIMQANKTARRSPFFPTENNSNLEVNKNGIRQSSR